MKRIGSGQYQYLGYTIKRLGYHHPDHCVWWEATDGSGSCCFHSKTKRDMKRLIDEYEHKERAAR